MKLSHEAMFIFLLFTLMETTITRLNHLLSATTVVSQKARLCHWNYEGLDFPDMHEQFEELYTYFSDLADEIAERVRALRAYPLATFAQYLQTTSIAEQEQIASNQMIDTLIADISHITGELRTWLADETDIATEGMFVEILTELEKRAWMLESSKKRA